MSEPDTATASATLPESDAELIARPIFESRYVVCCAPRIAPSRT